MGTCRLQIKLVQKISGPQDQYMSSLSKNTQLYAFIKPLNGTYFKPRAVIKGWGTYHTTSSTILQQWTRTNDTHTAINNKVHFICNFACIFYKFHTRGKKIYKSCTKMYNSMSLQTNRFFTSGAQHFSFSPSQLLASPPRSFLTKMGTIQCNTGTGFRVTWPALSEAPLVQGHRESRQVQNLSL